MPALGDRKPANKNPEASSRGRYRTASAQGRDDAACPRQRQHAQVGRDHGGGQPGSGVADGRGARIADIGDAFTRLEALHDLLGCLGFVVLVNGQGLCTAFADAIGAQQGLRVAVSSQATC